MNYEAFYLLINAAVVPAWALLILAPKANLTKQLVHSGIYPIIFGVLYGILLCLALFGGHGAEGAGMSSLAGVMALFDHPIGVLTGWVHYLVFDLFVGAWIGRDAQRRDIAHWKVIPALLFTFIFGPLGLLIYMGIRAVSKSQSLALDETV